MSDLSSKERIIAELDAAIAACKKTLGGRIGMSTAQFEALRSFVAAQPSHEPEEDELIDSLIRAAKCVCIANNGDRSSLQAYIHDMQMVLGELAKRDHSTATKRSDAP